MTSDGGGRGGLAWPDHDSGPTPPPYRGRAGRPKDEDRSTRKPLAFWDRIRILLFLFIVFGVLVWGSVASNPLLTLQDALILNSRSNGWLLALAGLELVRHVQYLISERWAG